MPAPCPTPPFAGVAPATHKLLVGTNGRWPHIGRHVWHRVHHAVHTVAANPQLSISGACHFLPGAVAALALTVMPATSPAPAPHIFLPPAAQTTTQSPEAGSAAASGAGTGSGGGSWAFEPATSGTPTDPGADTTAAALGSSIITMPDNTILSPPSLARNSYPHTTGTDPTSPVFQLAAADVTPLTDPAQPVPEPSSLAVLAVAFYGASLIKRESRGRSGLPARSRSSSDENTVMPHG